MKTSNRNLISIVQIAFDCEMVTTLINGYILSFQYMALTNTDED